MSKNLPTDGNETLAVSVADALTNSEKPANRMILIGEAKWITGIIHRLHTAGIADVGTWSQLMPTRNRGEMISVLKRPRVQEKI